VTCRDIENLIISHASGADMSPEAAAHIAGCERCQRWADALLQTFQVAAPSREQLQQIESRILAGLKPVKPLPPAPVLVLALVFALMVVAAAGSRALGVAGWQALSPLQRLAIFSALALTAGLLASSVIQQIVPGARLLVSPYLLVVAVLGVMLGICAALFHPHPEASFVSTGLVCLRIGVECATSAALLFWLLLRRGTILSPMLTGVTAGALAGLSGLTVLEIFCPNLNEYHILVWHLGAVLASVAAGLAIGTIVEFTAYSHTRHR